MLPNKTWKRERERKRWHGHHLHNLKSVFHRRIRADYHTELMRQHLLFTRSGNVWYRSTRSNGTKHSFPSLCCERDREWGGWGSGSVSGVLITDFEWTGFSKARDMIPLINPLLFSTTNVKLIMDANTDIKEVTGFNTPPLQRKTKAGEEQ